MIGPFLSGAALLFLVLALVGSLYAVAAGELLRGRLARRDPEPERWPGVTLLKPLRGVLPGLAADLQSVLAQDYPAPVQLLLGLHSADDPAFSVAQQVASGNAERDVRVVVDARAHGSNGKVSNLLNLGPHIRREVVVISDSDIRHPPDYLRRVVAALEQPGVGAVTCLYVGRPEGEGVWPRLAAMGTDLHFLPNVAVGLALGLAKPCFGSTIALRRETLDVIGGFAPFADLLADDYELGRAVRKLGLKVAVPSVLVEHAATEASLGEVFRHELRWARTIKRIDLAGHAGSLVTHAFPLALIGAALAQAGPLPFALCADLVLATALLARRWLSFRVARATRHRPAPLWMVPPRDILSFIVYLTSFGGDSVSWGGERFATDKHGAMRRRARQSR